MIMRFMSLPRSGLPATEATRLAWECLASAGQFGYGSFSCPCQKTNKQHPPNKQTWLYKPSSSEGLSF